MKHKYKIFYGLTTYTDRSYVLYYMSCIYWSVTLKILTNSLPNHFSFMSHVYTKETLFIIVIEKIIHRAKNTK